MPLRAARLASRAGAQARSRHAYACALRLRGNRRLRSLGLDAGLDGHGDLLVFHSHLMHRSTDNDSAGIRAAMVWHYAAAGTEDHTKEKFGFQNPSHDFMPVARRA